MKEYLGGRLRVFLSFAIVFSVFVIAFDFLIYNYYLEQFKQPISGHASNTADLSLSVIGDNIPPDIAITDPENATYTSHRTNLDYTVSDLSALSSCRYSLNNGVTNTTITCGNNVTGITSSEGGNSWRVYANDSSGNENSSSVTFVVSIPSLSDVSSGGGGGGGGASLDVSAKSFDVLPKELNVFLVSEGQDEKEIKVINTGPVSVSIDIEVTGVLDIASLNTDRIVLGPNEKENLVLMIKAPESGVHAGRIIFTSGNLRKEVFVLVNVRSEEESLFDVSLTIPESYKVIPINSDLRVFISLQQVGVPLGVDVIVNYIIKNFNGETVFTESETFFVLGNKGYVKDFLISKSPPGDYIVGMEVIYPGGFAASSSHFHIYGRQFNNFIIITIILFILALSVIIFSILKLRNKKDKHLNLIGRRGK